MDASTLTALIAALGGGSVITLLIRGIGRWVSGRAGRERSAIEYERRRARRAEERADREARDRGRIAEHAATLRYQMRERGLEPPEWPELEQTSSRQQIYELDKE